MLSFESTFLHRPTKWDCFLLLRCMVWIYSPFPGSYPLSLCNSYYSLLKKKIIQHLIWKLWLAPFFTLYQASIHLCRTSFPKACPSSFQKKKKKKKFAVSIFHFLKKMCHLPFCPLPPDCTPVTQSQHLLFQPCQVPLWPPTRPLPWGAAFWGSGLDWVPRLWELCSPEHLDILPKRFLSVILFISIHQINNSSHTSC